MNAKAYSGALALAALFSLNLFAQTDTPSSPPSPADQSTVAAAVVTVESGEHLVLELQENLNTAYSKQGEKASFTTLRELGDGNRIIIPARSTVQATLTEVKKPGRASRPGQIALQFDEITLPDGTTLPLDATLIRAGFTNITTSQGSAKVKGEGGTHKGDIVSVAIGAGQGALIGASVGGKKGAAYGSAVGAGIGVLQILLRKGPHLDLPRGMLFEVELDSSLGVPEASVARFSQPGALPPALSASTGSSNSGGFRFPDAVGSAAPGREAPIPDFPEDSSADEGSAQAPMPDEVGEEAQGVEEQPPAQSETTEVASNREPLPSPGAPSDLPETTAPPIVGPPPPMEDDGAYRMKVDVRLVMVEAFVRDEKGRVLDELKREDFCIFEDGVEQQVSHFSRDELPIAVALVVDRSGSVAPYMPELRRAAYQTLTQLKPGDQVALFAFDNDVDRLMDLTTDRRAIAERIARIRAGGGTNITDALSGAIQYLAAVAPERRRAIILISDSQATARGYTSQGDVIRMALESESVIYGVKTPGEPTPLTMRLPTWLGGLGSVRKMAEETGGEEIDVQRVGSLQAALAAVVSRLKTRYTLGYNSTNKARDGAFRRIEVRLADRFGRPQDDYSVFARRGYYAPVERRAAQQPADTP